MTVSQIHDPTTAAIEAAHIALELSAHAHYSQRMVFRVFNFTDIRAAIDAAQVARQQRNQPVTHHTVYVEARNSIHELVIDSDQISWPIGDGITTAPRSSPGLPRCASPDRPARTKRKSTDMTNPKPPTQFETFLAEQLADDEVRDAFDNAHARHRAVENIYAQAAILETQVAKLHQQIQETVEASDRLSCMQLGLMLRTIEPRAVRARLEWDNHSWHFEAALDAEGKNLPIDRTSAIWLEIEDGVDTAISQLSDRIATRPVIQFRDDDAMTSGESTVVEF